MERREVVDVRAVGQEPRQLAAPWRRVSSGSATTIRPSTESASGRPLRSRISAAVGRQLHGDGAAGGRRQGRVLLGAHALELHQPGAEERQHHGDEHEAGAQPELRAPRAARRRRRESAPGRRVRGAGVRPDRPRPRGLVVAIALLPARGQWLPEWGCACPCRSLPGAGERRCSCVVRGRRLDDGHVRRRVELGRLGGRGCLEPQGVQPRRRGRRTEHAAAAQVEHGGAGREHHPHPLRLERDGLRVAELVELHLEALLTGHEGVGLVLQGGRGERRLLHRGVEQEQSDDAAHRDHRDHERGTAPGCSGGGAASGRR